MNKVRMVSFFVILAMIFNFANVSPASAATTAVTLQESTATISQPQDGLFVYEAVDGITVGQDGNGLNGWATWNGSSTAQTAVWKHHPMSTLHNLTLRCIIPGQLHTALAGSAFPTRRMIAARLRTG